MSAVAVTPGAVARIRESKEVLKDELNVQVCFIFFITHRGGFRDVVVSLCLVDGVVSSFLSFFHRLKLPLRLKNSINEMFRSKS